MTKATLLFIWCVVISAADAGSYFITAPQTIQPGSVFDLTVDILNTSGVVVEASLQQQQYNGTTNKYDITTLQTASQTFNKGHGGKLSLPIANDFRCSSCRVNLRGSGGLQFERTFSAHVSTNVAAVLVQTDKAIYKPSQTVRFRVLAVYPDLQLYNGTFNIEIRDPNNNRIKVLNSVRGEAGVVENRLNLSDQPLFGTWTITVNLVQVSGSSSQTFEVSQYELPRFEVNVQLSPYALTSDTLLTGKVKATYTFGEPVKGFVELHVGPNQGPNTCGVLPKTTQIGFSIDGEASFSIPREDVQRAVNVINNQEVKVTAFVKEDATGVRLNGSSVVKLYDNKHQVKFTDNTPNVFKPGLPYTAFIQVSTPDDKPPTDKDLVVSVYTFVTYQLTVDDQGLYATNRFTGTYGLPGQNVTLPANGLLSIDVDIPKNATSIMIKASLKDVYDTKTVNKMLSQSNNFIQLSLLGSRVRSGSTVVFKVDGTEPLDKVSYKILSRGAVSHSGILNGQGKKSFTFGLDVTPDMAPTAHLLAYYTRGEDEVVADSLAFNVDGIFENEVAISFSKNESEPNKNLELNVAADPHSKVYVLAVDQSVLLLKSGNDITPDKVNTAVSKFDQGEKPSSSEFALSYSAQRVQDVFEKTGLRIISDVPLLSTADQTAGVIGPQVPSFITTPSYEFSKGAFDSNDRFGGAGGGGPTELKAVEHVRKLFPESWLWTTDSTGADGKVSISTQVPDTITSWIASAFATNPATGLGVAPTTAQLKVFRPFFVSVTIPSVVTRGEQLVIQATVFNYLPAKTSVTVTLRGSSKFRSIKRNKDLEMMESGDQIQKIEVETDKQGVAYFPILASEIGVIDIEIAAQSAIAADAVNRQIVVQPEGVPLSFNYPIFVDHNDNKNLRDMVDFQLPSSLVNGSERARVKVTGDLIGSSLESLTSLLELPTGCGEQSMVKFAPDVYVAEYLQITGQETIASHMEIVDLLEAGYQRQLTYQRYDGGFSPFGNLDESGSTWLTAYVSRVLNDAQKFIFLDTQVLVKAVDWLVARQNRDGSFSEFGKVIDRNIQGAGTGPALTAFVLLSLLKNRPLALQTCPKNTDCQKDFQWGNATVNATKNLEALVDANAIHDQFSLSVVSYALTLAKSSRASVAFTKLRTFAKSQGGLLYWSDNTTVSATESSKFLIWRPPIVQSRPLDILITSYAVLTYAAEDRLGEALPAVKWLTTQRNSLGGFASSQDTSVGLQALAAFASQSIRPDTKLDIKISSEEPLAEFHVDKSNALLLQTQELKYMPGLTNVDMSGTGFALVEIDVSFNVKYEMATPSFDVSTVLLDDELDSFNLMICTKWLWDRETGMVVQVVSIPSGFEPDLDSLSNVAGLRRSERKGNTLNIYFDQISKTSVCYSVRMTRTSKIARSQQSYIKTYDYYSPSDQATVFWQPKKLRDSTICDVCEQCCS